MWLAGVPNYFIGLYSLVDSVASPNYAIVIVLLVKDNWKALIKQNYSTGAKYTILQAWKWSKINNNWPTASQIRA